jgi:outer membrane lipoprotein-sorting protein
MAVVLWGTAACGGDLRGTETGALLDRWFAALPQTRTWTAEFVQTRALKAVAEPLISTGRVWVAVPDQFRWELGQPTQTIALRQKNQLLLIYPRLRRVEKYPLHDQRPGPWRDALLLLEAGFPQSRGDLESRFHLKSVHQTNGLFCLALEPKSASARRLLRGLRISFDTNTFSMSRMELEMADGSSLRNEFAQARLNPPLDEGCFKIDLEGGFTVTEPVRP